MNLFEKIRKFFPVKSSETGVEDEDGNKLSNADMARRWFSKASESLGDAKLKMELVKISFEEADFELGLKLRACDEMIAKGQADFASSKPHIERRRERAENEYIYEMADIAEEIRKAEQEEEQAFDALIKSLKTDGDFEYKKYMDVSLGRSRDSMPQISKADLDKILIHFSGVSNGSRVIKKSIPLKKLKPTQSEINENKVRDMVEKGYKPDYFITGKKGYLLDAHHGWAASLEQMDPESNVTVYQIKLDPKEALRRVNLLKGIERYDLEDQVVSKAIDIVAMASEEDQIKVGQIVRMYDAGKLEGEWICKAQVISYALDEAGLIKKAGEGSRGGHVIGHTKSGKPIYDSAKHPDHSSFTKQDHQDAIDAHKNILATTKNDIVGQERKKEWVRGSDSKTVFSHDHSKGQIAAHAQARFSAPDGGASGPSDAHKKRLAQMIEENQKKMGIDLTGKFKHKIEDVTPDGYGPDDAKKSDDLEIIKAVPGVVRTGKKVKTILGDMDAFSLIPEAKEKKGYADAIIRNSMGEILMLRRSSADDFMPGQWGLPGGKIEPNEEPIAAACRELEEETNLSCDSADCELTLIKDNPDNVIFYYDMGYLGDPNAMLILDGHEHDAYAWVSSKNLDKLDCIFDLKETLRKHVFVSELRRVPVYEKIEKSETEIGDDLIEKGKPAAMGEIREWAGVKWQKTPGGWKPIKGNGSVKHAPSKLKEHAERTSLETLQKVSKTHKDPSVRDAAKRELEERTKDQEKEKRQWKREDSVKKEERKYQEGQVAKEKKEQKDQADAKAKEADAKAKEQAREQEIKEASRSGSVKYDPQPGLSDEDRDIETRFGKYLNDSFEEAKGRYIAKFGNVLNTDNARELSDDYEANRAEKSAAVHEPSSSFIKKRYEEMLAEKPDAGKRAEVLFTAGGTGAGKTTGMQAGKMKGHLDKAHIVYDTNMNGFSSAAKKIDQALGAKKAVRIAFTFRDPIDAYENGAVPRSLRIGRTVPIHEHVKTHLGSMETFMLLKEKYKDNPKVRFNVIDNSRGAGKAAVVNEDFLKSKLNLYNAGDLTEKLHAITDKLHKEGKISDQHYKGFKGGKAH